MEVHELYQIRRVSLNFAEELEPLKCVKNLVIHHTEEMNWDIYKTHDYHLYDKNWSGIGYNYFIDGSIKQDGYIFEGRGLYKGAHTLGHNETSIGICLSGNFDIHQPTKKQMLALTWLCKKLMGEFGLLVKDIVGHRELGAKKSCPGKNFDLEQFRQSIASL
ncbi:peptidoglycan recognition family protein [Fredinandcohnia humi]